MKYNPNSMYSFARQRAFYFHFLKMIRRSQRVRRLMWDFSIEETNNFVYFCGFNYSTNAFFIYRAINYRLVEMPCLICGVNIVFMLKLTQFTLSLMQVF